MAGALKGIYNRRHPERTDYYRIIEGSFEEFERSYPDQFEEKYGYLRTEVMKAIYSFLECGIPENGMARVRCEECGHDFSSLLLPLSCCLPQLFYQKVYPL